MATVAELVVQNVQNYGLTQYILPFILLFAIVFGVMENASILSKKKNVQAVVSFVVTALAILSPVGASLANFFSLFAARVGIVMVSVLFGMLSLMVGWRAVREFQGKDTDMGNASSWVFWVSVIVVVVLFITSGGIDLLGLSIPNLRLSGDVIAGVSVIGIIIAMFALMFWMAGSEASSKKKEKERTQKRMRKLLGFD